MQDYYAGMPKYPDYQGLPPGVNIDQSPYSLAKNEAAAPAGQDSIWARLAKQQNNFQGQQANQNVRKQAASAGADSLAQLAMRGNGVSSGAVERNANNTARNVLNMSQNQAFQTENANLGIGRAAEQNRLDAIGGLAGIQNQTLNPYFKQQELKNQYDMNKYNTQGQIWGAGKQAENIENSAK